MKTGLPRATLPTREALVQQSRKLGQQEGRANERQNVLDLLLGNLAAVEQRLDGTTSGKPKLTLTLSGLDLSDVEGTLEQLIDQIRSGDHIP